MYILRTSASFDSAHFLSGYNGKCANIHGHTWKIEAEAAGKTLISTGEKRGMVIDFGDLKSAVRTLADEYDHALLYERGTLGNKTIDALTEEGFKLISLDYRPTAENFARSFFCTLKERGLPVSRVTVYETADNCAAYSEEIV